MRFAWVGAVEEEDVTEASTHQEPPVAVGVGVSLRDGSLFLGMLL